MTGMVKFYFVVVLFAMQTLEYGLKTDATAITRVCKEVIKIQADVKLKRITTVRR